MGDDDQLEVRHGFSFSNDTVARDGIRDGQQEARGEVSTHSTKLSARASMFSESSAFVGSSRARMPQFCPKESESASLIMMLASIFCPALHRPLMSISTWSFVMTTR